MKLVDTLGRLPWPKRLACASTLLAGLVWFRLLLLLGLGNLEIIPLLAGLCIAWAGSTTAALLLGLTAIERLRGRPFSVPASPALGWSFGLLGAGLMLAGGTLIASTGTISTMSLAGVGAVGVAVALWLRRQPPQSVRTTLFLLLAAIALFQVPREEGLFSLRWNSVEHRASWSSSGGEQCTGMNLGDRPATIAAYRPAFFVAPTLSGSLGRRVNERLGGQGAQGYPPGTAVVSIFGHIDYGDPLCYAPLVKSQTIRGRIDMTTTLLLLGGEGEGAAGDDSWSLNCTDTRTLDFTIESTSTGLSSCRDLADEAASQLIAQISAQANAVTGR